MSQKQGRASVIVDKTGKSVGVGEWNESLHGATNSTAYAIYKNGMNIAQIFNDENHAEHKATVAGKQFARPTIEARRKRHQTYSTAIDREWANLADAAAHREKIAKDIRDGLFSKEPKDGDEELRRHSRELSASDPKQHARLMREPAYQAAIHRGRSPSLSGVTKEYVDALRERATLEQFPDEVAALRRMDEQNTLNERVLRAAKACLDSEKKDIGEAPVVEEQKPWVA